jgi:hypothetical protein
MKTKFKMSISSLQRHVVYVWINGASDWRVPPPVCERIRAGSAMFIRRKLALQGIPIKRRGGSRKIFVSIFQFIVESYQ